MIAFKKALQLTEESGIIIDYSRDQDYELLDLIAPAMALFKGIMQHVALLYTFRLSDQGEEFATTGGYNLKFENLKTGEKCYSIGISDYAISLGPEMAVFVFLHELCHCIDGLMAHGPEYHAVLSGMIEIYNWRFGTDIKNDKNQYHDYLTE